MPGLLSLGKILSFLFLININYSIDKYVKVDNKDPLINNIHRLYPRGKINTCTLDQCYQVKATVMGKNS